MVAELHTPSARESRIACAPSSTRSSCASRETAGSSAAGSSGTDAGADGDPVADADTDTSADAFGSILKPILTPSADSADGAADSADGAADSADGALYVEGSDGGAVLESETETVSGSAPPAVSTFRS